MSGLVSIIIPTWNRRDLLAECLSAIERQTFQGFEVIVVDDGSTDGTHEWVEARFPYARVLRLPTNRGFCAAVNAGIRLAEHPWLLLLNDDMALERNCLLHLVEAAEITGADMLTPVVLFRDDPERVYGAGDRLRTSGRPESIGFRELRATFRPPVTVFGVSAGAALYRRAVFDAVGVFDEHFVAYFDDADLGFRARLRGFRPWVVCQAQAYHVGSASIQGRTWWRASQCFRNHALVVLKDFPAPLLLRHLGAIWRERRHQRARLFSAARVEFGAVGAAVKVCKAWLSLCGAIPAALHARWRIQRTRTLELAALDALLTPEAESTHGGEA